MRQNKFDVPPAFRNHFSEGVDTQKIGGGEAKFPKAQLGANIVVVKVGEDIQKAIDTIRDTNGGKVFLRNGTHYPKGDLTLYSNITLEGESTYGAIIDFDSQAYSVRIEGSDAYSTGTVTVTQGGTTVTGSGTVWTSEMEGQSIVLDGDVYYVVSVNSETELSLDTGFAGSDQVGISYIICTTINGVFIKNLTIQNSSTRLVIGRYAYRAVIEYTETYGGDTALYFQDSWGLIYNQSDVMDCAAGIYLENCWSYFLNGFYIFNCVGNGLELNGGGDSTVFNFGVSKCNGVGLKLTDTLNVAFLSLTIDNCGSHGVELSGSNDNIFDSGTIADNGGEGVKLTATSDGNFITKTTNNDNALYGINIANANCDNNLILGNNFSGNASGQVSDSGTGTLTRSNIGQADN